MKSLDYRHSKGSTGKREDSGAALAVHQWLECSDLRLLGDVGDVSARWRLEQFCIKDKIQIAYFEQLDGLCRAAARSRRSPGDRIAGIKAWLALELQHDVDLDDYVKAFELDKRDEGVWERIYAAAAATILLVYCKAQASGRQG